VFQKDFGKIMLLLNLVVEVVVAFTHILFLLLALGVGQHQDLTNQKVVLLL
jgi:hypothetical protein